MVVLPVFSLGFIYFDGFLDCLNQMNENASALEKKKGIVCVCVECIDCFGKNKKSGNGCECGSYLHSNDEN